MNPRHIGYTWEDEIEDSEEDVIDIYERKTAEPEEESEIPVEFVDGLIRNHLEKMKPGDVLFSAEMDRVVEKQEGILYSNYYVLSEEGLPKGIIGESYEMKIASWLLGKY